MCTCTASGSCIQQQSNSNRKPLAMCGIVWCLVLLALSLSVRDCAALDAGDVVVNWTVTPALLSNRDRWQA